MWREKRGGRLFIQMKSVYERANEMGKIFVKIYLSYSQFFNVIRLYGPWRTVEWSSCKESCSSWFIWFDLPCQNSKMKKKRKKRFVNCYTACWCLRLSRKFCKNKKMPIKQYRFKCKLHFGGVKWISYLNNPLNKIFKMYRLPETI